MRSRRRVRGAGRLVWPCAARAALWGFCALGWVHAAPASAPAPAAPLAPAAAAPALPAPTAALAAPPGAATRRPPSRAEIEAAVAKLKADPNLGGTGTTRQLKWIGQQEDKPPAAIPNWINGLFGFMSRSLRAFMWVLGALALAFAAVWALRMLRAQRVPAVPRAAPPAGTEETLDLDPASLPADIGAAARALLDAGRAREALSLLYRGALSRAVHRFGVAIGESMTEGEALTAVRARLDSARGRYFAELIGLWQAAVYAGSGAAAEPIARLCTEFAPLLEGEPA